MNTFISYLNIYIYIDTIDNGEAMLNVDMRGMIRA